MAHRLSPVPSVCSLATLVLLHPATPTQAAPLCTFRTPIGASNDPGALGFSDRITMQGCR